MQTPLFQPRTYHQHLQRSIQNSADIGPYTSYQCGTDWREGCLPFEAAVEAARLLASEYPGPYLVPLSGGIDSECVFRAFLAAKIPARPVIMRFKNGFNDFDTVTAFQTCKSLGVEPVVLDLDLDEFFKSEKHLEYAEKYRCSSPQLATHLWLAEQIEGTLVFSYNPLALLYDAKRTSMYWGFPPELYLCYDNFFEKNQRGGVGLFFLYTANLIYSFLQLPLSRDMSLYPNVFFRRFSTDQYFIKTELYRTGGFQAKARSYKATGFENYRKFLNEKYQFNRGDYFDVHYRRPMETLAKIQPMAAIGDIDLKRLYDYWTSRPSTV